MTPEERQMLTDLTNKIAQAPSTPKDAEADELIRSQIGSRPDALYVLTQTVLIQNMAIEHAKQQIQDLQQRSAPSPQAPGGFIPPGRGSGWTAPPSGPPAPQPQYNAPYSAPPPLPPPSAPSGASSFLRSAAITATGVAAGALAFEGIRSLFGGVEHMLGFGGGPHPGSFLGGGVPGETIINNYYDSPGGGRDSDDRSFDDSDSNTVDVPDDSSSFDDNSVDDSSSDDSGFSGGDDSI